MNTDAYEKMTWETPSDELADAVENLLAEVKRLRDAALDARILLMKHHEWMSVNDATSEEDDEEILTVVRALREASE